MPIRSFIDKSEVVPNQNRKFGSSLEYYPCYVKRLDGTVVPALFTAAAIHEAVERAAKNPEDISERASWLDRIFG